MQPSRDDKELPMDDRLEFKRLGAYVWGRRWWIGIFCATVAILVLLAVAVLPKGYVSSARILILSPVATTELEPHYELTIASYMELIRGDELLQGSLEAVSAKVGKPVEQLRGARLDVAQAQGSRVLILTAATDSSRVAALVANEASRRFVEGCARIRDQAIADERALIEHELKDVEKQISEEWRRRDQLLAQTGQRTAQSVRAQIERLREAPELSTQDRPRDAETVSPPSGGAAEGPGPPSIQPGAGRNEQRVADLMRMLESQRDTFEAIDLQGMKLDRLREAQARLSEQSLGAAELINRRLGAAQVISTAQEPTRPWGPPAAALALLGAFVALILSVTLLLLRAQLTGAHLERQDARQISG